jgi:DNA mismatch endonuclease (patch repair protein)
MLAKKYIRDKRSPKPKNENVSKVMSANKAKNSKPEIMLRQELWRNGMRGYRLHYNKIPGRPDVCFVSNKLAIFVNGCFWHRCPHCNYPLPKNNRKFWIEKFRKNKARDIKKKKELKKIGWHVLIVWECQIEDYSDEVVKGIEKILD